MQDIRVTIDQIKVTKDWDPSGKGELYWIFRANGTTIDERKVSSAKKVSSGETIVIDESKTVRVDDNDTFRVYIAVNDKDGDFDGADESDEKDLNCTVANNWGDGPLKVKLSDSSLEATIWGQIDAL